MRIQRCFSFVMMLTITTATFCQSKLVQSADYDLEAYVFSDNYKVNFLDSAFESRFTPTIDDVLKAETLLAHFDIKSRKASKKQRRQYVGFKIRESQYVLIHAMHYRRAKCFSRDYPGWESNFAYLLGGHDEMQKSHLYVVNLTDGTIGFYE